MIEIYKYTIFQLLLVLILFYRKMLSESKLKVHGEDFNLSKYT